MNTLSDPGRVGAAIRDGSHRPEITPAGTPGGGVALSGSRAGLATLVDQWDWGADREKPVDQERRDESQAQSRDMCNVVLASARGIHHSRASTAYGEPHGTGIQ